MQKKISDVLAQYSQHPDFIGVDLVDVNQQGAVDDAPLHIAVRKGSVEDVLDLLNLGAKINMLGDLGNTPLHYAALVGRPEMAQLLVLKGANPAMLNEFNETPLLVAQQGGKTDVVSILKRDKSD